MTLTERFHRLPDRAWLGTLTLAPGGVRDYLALCEHHYRSARPATMTRVFTLRDHRPSVAGRFLSRPSQTLVVGVAVESLPALSCSLRDFATHGRFRAPAGAAERAALLNAELRCISRVVIDPRYRGLGLAVRLVRALLDTATTPLTEAIAAMGQVHPFFQHAGMTPYHRPALPHDARLLAALEHAGCPAASLARTDRLAQRIEQLPEPTRRWLLTEVQRWHQSIVRRRDACDLREALSLAQRRLLCQPVYYLHVTPPGEHHGHP